MITRSTTIATVDRPNEVFSGVAISKDGKSILAETRVLGSNMRITNPDDMYIHQMFPMIIPKDFGDYDLPPFRMAIMAPSVDDYGNIYFRAKSPVGVGQTFEWWEENAKEFLPSYESDLATVQQQEFIEHYIIRELVGEGMAVREAWEAVYQDSKAIGNYTDSKNHVNEHQLTGSRRVGKLFDLATPKRIIKGAKGGLLQIGGGYDVSGATRPLGFVQKVNDKNAVTLMAVGQIVLNKVD